MCKTTIETARLRLRSYHDGDLTNLVQLAGGWEVAGWLSNLPYPYTVDHGREWISHVQKLHAAGNPCSFAIALKETDELIGGIGLDGDTGDGTDEPSLGYWIGTPYHMQGYAKEAVKAVIHYGFDKLKLESIRAVTAPDNIASQQVLLKCGLSTAGEIELRKPMRRGASRGALFRISHHWP